VKLRVLLRRFLVPAPVVTALCWARFKARVSPRAEVELSPLLKLGRGVNVASFCKIKASAGPLEIGRNTSIATGCFLAGGSGGLIIGDDVLIGPNCVILTSKYVFDDISRPIRLQGQRSLGTRIANNVFLGAGTVVLDGSEVGEGVIVAPNSVVGGRIPANTIIQGNPARVVFRRRH
jgi:acetyltransferase-like isoleucine patch superfamily enzyme